METGFYILTKVHDVEDINLASPISWKIQDYRTFRSLELIKELFLLVDRAF